ncbi:hypothetical protein [Rhodocyclus tenuis]|uniref:Uncharacterized protein n=1 Tax=Rhodocyclus tenuis TaxID=1066 RepID=A0A840G5W0_RHOTE|nr:hypothetical protein [Rhodocyclus tenuis]MBB4246118.1 hypothetical protein [Rhodocyclus tenuis]
MNDSLCVCLIMAQSGGKARKRARKGHGRSGSARVFRIRSSDPAKASSFSAPARYTIFGAAKAGQRLPEGRKGIPVAIIMDMNGNCTQDTDVEFRAALGPSYSEEILSAGWTEVPRPEVHLLSVATIAAETGKAEAASAPPGFDVDGFLARVYASQE